MADRKHSTRASSKPKPWNDPKVRATAFQILLFSLIGYGLYTLYSNVSANLARQNIASGFDFLSDTAGFDIVMSLTGFDADKSYLDVYLTGIANTLLVSVLGIISATLVGLAVGIGRLSNNWLVKKFCGVYVEVFRNTPVLLQIFFWYIVLRIPLPNVRESWTFLGAAFNNRGIYLPAPVSESGFGYVLIAALIAVVIAWAVARWAKQRKMQTGQEFPTLWACLAILVALPLITFFILGRPMHIDYPELKGFNYRGGIPIIPELSALWVALTIYTGSYIAEIVRAGIQSVPKGQIEASQALGLPKLRTLRFIVLPQALRVMIPPLTSQYLNLAKNSSLATAIGYPDVVNVFAGTALNNKGQAIEFIAMTMLVYLTFSIVTSVFMGWYNKRNALIER